MRTESSFIYLGTYQINGKPPRYLKNVSNVNTYVLNQKQHHDVSFCKRKTVPTNYHHLLLQVFCNVLWKAAINNHNVSWTAKTELEADDFSLQAKNHQFNTHHRDQLVFTWDARRYCITMEQIMACDHTQTNTQQVK